MSGIRRPDAGKTILRSWPAIGGRYLRPGWRGGRRGRNGRTSLIVDGQVTLSTEGATVGEYKTCVQAANLLSIALGGDSHITYSRDGQILVGPERVLPLSHLAAENPDVGKRLKALTGCVRKECEVFLVVEAILFELKGIKASKDIDPATGINLLKIIGV
jgi:hypothetical protein